jgi:hypothetical protein
LGPLEEGSCCYWKSIGLRRSGLNVLVPLERISPPQVNGQIMMVGGVRSAVQVLCSNCAVPEDSRLRINEMPLPGGYQNFAHYQRVPTCVKLDCALIVAVFLSSS